MIAVILAPRVAKATKAFDSLTKKTWDCSNGSTLASN